MTPLRGPTWIQRLLAVLLTLIGIPGVLSVAALLEDAPIRVGVASPRTVIAPDLIRVTDPDATERERREAAAGIPEVTVADREAKIAIVQDVEDAFERVEAVSQPGAGEGRPSQTEQIDALAEQLPGLEREAIEMLVGLSEDELSQVAQETEQIAEALARQNIREDQVEQFLDQQLPEELLFAAVEPEVAEEVVAPLVRDAMRPTVRVDEAATAAAREAAAENVAPVERTYAAGQVIVSAGEVVDEVQFEALRTRGLEGAEPLRQVARELVLVLVATGVVVFYLRVYRMDVWSRPRKLILLSCLFLLFTVALTAVTVLVPETSPGWLYLVPVGTVAMLATILFDPSLGALTSVPVAVLVAYAVPGRPGVTAFAALAALGSVPLVSRLSARGALRRAGWQSTLGYCLLAGVFVVVFDDVDRLPWALGAGLLNGVVTAVIVNGSLPFLESVFGILTTTSLQDLADRNHPLLRELESKALGSYNHSIMVSTLCERAARRIGADSLLSSTAALYHDIGKVRRPYFFVENQFGIANPHDELPPETSAQIIQSHVTDGMEMARTSRLPPEIVEGIATHHGTTLVSYFYREAVNDAVSKEQVDEQHYRYKGHKPASKEMAILMLADSCEGASRAAALHDRNLTRDDLERIVHRLIEDRVDDGQLDEANLTFRELTHVRESFIESLVGVYHPRIAYPKQRDATPEEQGEDAYVTTDGQSRQRQEEARVER